MKNEIKLIALDMDGTLFNCQSQISAEDQQAIRDASDAGIEVAISTGRPYVGLPAELLQSIGIRYAITSNGAAIYRLADRECIASDCMSADLIVPIIRRLQKLELHMDAFIDGNSYSQHSCRPLIDQLALPESVRTYIKATRIFVEDLADLITEKKMDVQKMTLNFLPLPDGTRKNRNAAQDILRQHPEVMFLSGGFLNIEFTKTGTTKGMGLCRLCDFLDIPLAQTMACGDTQNDIDILKTAAVGVAMGNAIAEVKEAANFVTRTNEESGVGFAIRTICGV